MLNRFDRMHTEPAALSLMIPAWLILVLVSNSVSVRDLEMREFVLAGGVTTFALNLLFLIGYISLVRRIKAHTLWKNSVFCLVCNLFGEIMRNRKTTTKTMLSYAGFLLVNVVLLIMGEIGIALLAFFDLGVGIFLLRQAAQRQRILDGIKRISAGELNAQIPTDQISGDNLAFAGGSEPDGQRPVCSGGKERQGRAAEIRPDYQCVP